ncbi:VQ motif-containing protein 4-like [Macadamia integrifolia]|uniref:VQ motif-containing protein 4-like n=1 Tax=Macadamia integrifolia TaxID=60698 RepID=UPI001C4F6EDD|nr:VQ motif-containing protein 4-like [Macadamia integrifolia]
MENSPRRQEGENPSALASPKSNSSSSSSSNSNGVQHPLTPKSIARSDANAYPTTFIQADTSSFKQVVQMLTGSSETAKQASKVTSPADPSNKSAIPPIKSGPKKQGFKLYERRNSLKNLKISPLMPGSLHQNSGFSPRKPEILSPSLLDFPGLVLSPVTPLIPDPFNRSPPTCNTNSNDSICTSMAEEKAIAEKGFYLHPSPITTPRDSEPRLLPLFPVTSPKVSGSSS